MKKTEKIAERKRLINILQICLLVIAVICGAALFYHEHAVNQKKESLIDEARTNSGAYHPSHLMLTRTNRERAEALAKRIGATCRTTSDGSFAVLYFPEEVDLEEVIGTKECKNYLNEIALDYYAYLCEEETQEYEYEPAENLYSFNDTYFAKQDYLNYLNLGDSLKNTNGEGTMVAVIDTGIDTDHPEFSGRISEYSYNASEEKTVLDYGNSVVSNIK